MARSSQALLRQVRTLRKKVDKKAAADQVIADSEAKTDYHFAIYEGWDLDPAQVERANAWAKRNGMPPLSG